MRAVPFHQADVLATLSKAEVAALEGLVERVEVEPGQLLVREDEAATHVYIIGSGRFEVGKLDDRGTREYLIDELGPGEVAGELALIDGRPRAASVRAATEGLVYALPVPTRSPDGAVELSDRSLRSAYRKLESVLAAVVTDRLRRQADQAVDAARREKALGDFLVNTFTLLSLYLILIGGLPSFEQKLRFDRALLSFPVQLVFAFGAVQFIRMSGYPLRQFGLSYHQLMGSLFEGVLFTVPFLAVVTGVKWLVKLVDPAQIPGPVIEHPDVLARLADPHVQTWLWIYGVSCLVQELIVRGAIQSGLELFLVGRYRVRRAIVVSTLLFAVTHLHLSFLFAMLALLPGLLWSWMFSRRKNIVGVTLSHAVVGSYVFFVLGAPLPA